MKPEAKPAPGTNPSAVTIFDNLDLLPGNVRLQSGDVFRYDGVLHLVTKANDCRAMVIPLVRQRRTFQPRFDEEKVEFDAPSKSFGISTQLEAGMVLARMGAKWCEDFLAGRATADEVVAKCGEINTNTKGNMKNKSNSPAQGGLAAAAREAKKNKTNGSDEPTTKGALGELFGHSITSVIRAMGKLGLNWHQAKKALVAKGLKPADATVKIQINRAKVQEPAKLTQEQKDELVNLAGPVEAEKPKPAKGKAKKAKTEAAKTEPETATAA